MFDAKKCLRMMEKISACDKKMDALMNDFSDEAEEKFDKLCDERDSMIDFVVDCLKSIGIEQKTARYMVMNCKMKGKLVSILKKAA